MKEEAKVMEEAKMAEEVVCGGSKGGRRTSAWRKQR